MAQRKKDSNSKRVNYDNTRINKFDKDMRKEQQASGPRGKMVWLKQCEAAKNSDNDISWYWRNPDMAESAGRIGFSRTTGMPDGNGIITPGIMSFFWESACDLGYAQAINEAANSLYSNIVHANSRNTSYTALDLMMLIMAGKEVFSAIAHGIRAYGLMLQTNQENFYCPSGLLNALGFDYADLKANYSHMQSDLNRLIADSRQIWLPNTLPVIHRAFWMNTNIYTDSDNEKAQYYAYVPACFKIYDETGSASGGRVIPAPSNKWSPLTKYSSINLSTWQNYIDAVDELIQALVLSEDRGVIFGDILKAYGEGSIFKIEYIDVNYSIKPVYNTEVLMQMENATFPLYNMNSTTSVDMRSYGISFIQDQTHGAILGAAAASTASTAAGRTSQSVGMYYPKQPIINFHFKGQPTAQQIMLATRMTACGSVMQAGPDINNPTTVYGVWPRSVGTERCVAVKMFKYTSGRNITALPIPQLLDISVTPSAAVIERLANHAQFDWSPIVYLVNPNNLANPFDQMTWEPEDYFGDIDNYIVVHQSEIARLHNAAIMSEFGVPVL